MGLIGLESACHLLMHILHFIYFWLRCEAENTVTRRSVEGGSVHRLHLPLWCTQLRRDIRSGQAKRSELAEGSGDCTDVHCFHGSSMVPYPVSSRCVGSGGSGSQWDPSNKRQVVKNEALSSGTITTTGMIDRNYLWCVTTRLQLPYV